MIKENLNPLVNVLASRTSFLSLYAIAKDVLGPLVEELDERSVFEYVSNEGVLTIPLVRQSVEKPLPLLEIKSMKDHLSIGLAYKGADEIRHIKNLLHPSQIDVQNVFTNSMKLLPVAFETRLYKRGFKEFGFTFVKKYVASRVDAAIVGLLVDETEAMRSGGRRIVDGRSVYEAPAMPLLCLVYLEMKSNDLELRTVLYRMRSIITIAVGVKTQREIIHSRISKPVDQANQYRTIIQLLNKARSHALISAVERRDLEKKWRNVLEEKGVIEEDLKRRLGETT